MNLNYDALNCYILPSFHLKNFMSFLIFIIDSFKLSKFYLEWPEFHPPWVVLLLEWVHDVEY